MTKHLKLRQNKPFDLDAPTYKPEELLDEVSRRLQLKNDFALSVKLNMDHAIISKIRNRKGPISAFAIVRILDATGMSIAEFREISGIPSNLEQG